MKHAIERHLFVSDFQIPEQDDLAIDAVLKFIPDFKPDYVHFVGDILDLTKFSKFEIDPTDKHTVMDEILTARTLLKRFREAAPKASMHFYEGNHCRRMPSYIARNAPALAEIPELNISYQLQLKQMGIQWHPYNKTSFLYNRFIVEHGDCVAKWSGMTAQKMLHKRWFSGFSGHSHRLGIYMETNTGVTRWWCETGNLCKLYFQHGYMKEPNWQQGFILGFYDTSTKTMHPQVVPMFDRSFVYEGKFYSPTEVKPKRGRPRKALPK